MSRTGRSHRLAALVDLLDDFFDIPKLLVDGDGRP